MPDPLFRLISTESEVPRPRVLCEGTLAACLDELKEAVLVDVAQCNRGALAITAVFETPDGPRRELDVPLATLKTSGNGY